MFVYQFFSSPLYVLYCIVSAFVFIIYMRYFHKYKATNSQKSNRRKRSNIVNKANKSSSIANCQQYIFSLISRRKIREINLLDLNKKEN